MTILEAKRGQHFLRVLQERLRGYPLEHYISTAEYLAVNRDKMGISLCEATEAGLLHDICKHDGDELLLAKAQEYGIPVSDVQREFPTLLHGPVAAEECHRNHDLPDSVYEAIYWHTTGKPELGLVGLALYFADYAEPLRIFPEAQHARNLLDREGFGTALRFVVANKHAYIMQKHTHVDPMTHAFFEWLQQAPEVP